jgi:hypothetical protein
MKKLFFPLALLLAACTGDGALSVQNAAQQNAALAIRQEANPAWQYESLRLYPVTGSASLQAQTSSYENMKLLSEAMKIPGFRVMEQKQFGRSESQWFHGVTVQNKTQDTVLLLSGDVVKGGNQDRVIAHHEVILPRSVRNIEVFCVEAGRSTYYNPQASAAEKEVAAFSGYFSVASPKVRRAVQNPGQQQAVWDAVANVTKANAAESSTSAYTTLDNESEQKKTPRRLHNASGRRFCRRSECSRGYCRLRRPGARRRCVFQQRFVPPRLSGAVAWLCSRSGGRTGNNLPKYRHCAGKF